MADLRIKSSKTPWRRGGIAFATADWVEVKGKSLADQQRLQILADPLLTVEARANAKADWELVDDEAREAARLELHGDGAPGPAPALALFRYEIRGPEDCVQMGLAVSAWLKAHPEGQEVFREAMVKAEASSTEDGASVSSAASSTSPRKAGKLDADAAGAPEVKADEGQDAGGAGGGEG